LKLAATRIWIGLAFGRRDFGAISVSIGFFGSG